MGAVLAYLGAFPCDPAPATHLLSPSCPHAQQTHPFFKARGQGAETQLLENTFGLIQSHFQAPGPGCWGSGDPEKGNDLAEVTRPCMKECG